MPRSESVSSRHPWADIKATYVEGFITPEGHRRYPPLDELAQKFAVNVKLIKKRSAREDWVGCRNEFVAAVEAARRRDKIAALSGVLSEVDNECFRVARAGLALVARKMQALGEARSADGKAVPPDGLDLTRLAMAARVYQQIAKVAAGEESGDSLPRLQGMVNEGSNASFTVRIVRDGAGYDPPPNRKVIDAG